jgi:urease accessory protein
MFMTIEAPRTEVSGVLFAWFSPAFPTGGFGYSHGIESAAADARIDGEAHLLAWLTDILNQGAGWTDSVLFALAHRAVLAGDNDRLADFAALATAYAPSRERLAETLGQGAAFLAAVNEGWPDAAAGLAEEIAYPVAAGACCGRIGASLPVALEAYLTAFCANLIAAGVRLGLCGQKAGVRILSALGQHIGGLAARASRAEEDDLGGCAFGSDIASMRHEVLEGRLFLS